MAGSAAAPVSFVVGGTGGVDQLFHGVGKMVLREMITAVVVGGLVFLGLLYGIRSEVEIADLKSKDELIIHHMNLRMDRNENRAMNELRELRYRIRRLEELELH